MKTPIQRKKVPGQRLKPSTAGPAVGFPIVGVGASAGGLEAFTQLLQNLPTTTGMGFVLVQHLDPDHVSALTQLLSKAPALRGCSPHSVEAFSR
jgi:two-component system, chemotaxis family, CheB/CheR fusion protein